MLEETLERIELRLAAVEERLKDQRRLLRQFPAVVRKRYLDGVSLPPEFELRARRFDLGSKNEEDGILLELFRRIGTTDRRFVGIGCGVNGGNMGFLAADCRLKWPDGRRPEGRCREGGGPVWVGARHGHQTQGHP